MMKHLMFVYHIVTIACTLPICFLLFVLSHFWYKVSMDPSIEKISLNGRTPVLLLHGSSSHQHQWLFFRYFLNRPLSGHIFSLNLNDEPMKNNKDCDMDTYVQVVHNKLLEMQQIYLEAGYKMDEVILVGNSLGGLIAAAYFVANSKYKDSKILNIGALITISTPWRGSPLADHFYKDGTAPGRYLRTDSLERDNLVLDCMELADQCDLPIYNYGSNMDFLVSTFSCKLPTARATFIEDRNDHWTTMLDYKLAHFIGDAWIIPHTNILSRF
jgi:pimeloyl-ACP methyl ester carboxylesterase